jgi:hypothetical protein
MRECFRSTRSDRQVSDTLYSDTVPTACVHVSTVHIHATYVGGTSAACSIYSRHAHRAFVVRGQRYSSRAAAAGVKERERGGDLSLSCRGVRGDDAGSGGGGAVPPHYHLITVIVCHCDCVSLITITITCSPP